MTLFYPLLNEPIRFSEDQIAVLIVEHRGELRKAVCTLQEQMAGADGPFVLGQRGEIRPISKEALLITDPFSVELDGKRLLTKITQEAEMAGTAYGERLQELLLQLNEIAAQISTELEFEASFTELESWGELIHLMGFRVDTENLSFSERLLEYMKLQRKFFGKRLFVFFNLKACLTEKECLLLYKSVQYEKLQILLLEDLQRTPLKEYENTVLIDEDLCVF